MEKNKWLWQFFKFIIDFYFDLFLKKKKNLFKEEKPITNNSFRDKTYNQLTKNQKELFKSRIQYIFDCFDDFQPIFIEFENKGNTIANLDSFIIFVKKSKKYKKVMIMHILKSIIKIAFFIYSIWGSIYICEDKSFTNCTCSYNDTTNTINISIYNNNITIFNRNNSNTINYNSFYYFNKTSNESIDNNNFTYYINYFINNNIINISNNNSKYKNTINNNYWYCQYGKCNVNKILFNMTKILKLIYFVGFDLFLIVYIFIFLFIFKKVIQLKDDWLIIYQLFGHILLIGIFLSNLFDTKKCVKVNGNLFNKDNEIDLIYLILDIILSGYLY